MPVYELSEELLFPPLHHAEPDGLLAFGGDLSVERLVLAYRSGLFPWFNEGDPILWWSPDPRLVLFPEELKISRSLVRRLRSGRFTYSMNRDFEGVMRQCAQCSRPGQEGETWINDAMIHAYMELHRAGVAHSVEVYREEVLVGGLYGVAIGACFFGESMFALETDASKCGFATFVSTLQELGFEMIDCQVHTGHLERFGAREISREDFLLRLERLCAEDIRLPIEGRPLPLIDK